uniref:Uncharacterized protein n=1 Tax=Rhizophora mucronata TaxID=61149 RepID=A0A2P2P7I7_RHIMU
MSMFELVYHSFVLASFCCRCFELLQLRRARGHQDCFILNVCEEVAGA